MDVHLGTLSINQQAKTIGNQIRCTDFEESSLDYLARAGEGGLSVL